MEFKYQAVAVLLTLTGLLIVFELIRRRQIQDVLWLPWIMIAMTPTIVGLWIRPWALLAQWLGILYEPLLLVALGSVLSFAMLMYLTVVVSSLIRKNLRLAQELALMREELRQLTRKAECANASNGAAPNELVRG
jgi:integral membrane sensor domain MASE1